MDFELDFDAHCFVNVKLFERVSLRWPSLRSFRRVIVADNDRVVRLTVTIARVACRVFRRRAGTQIVGHRVVCRRICASARSRKRSTAAYLAACVGPRAPIRPRIAFVSNFNVGDHCLARKCEQNR